MNNVYLCVGNYAKNPFYVNFSDIYLYSMEELCYYFIDKIYLLDYDIINQPLVDWIRQECGMTQLADELDIYVRKHVSVAAFVTTILEQTGIYEENVVKKVDRVLKEQAGMSPYERLKKRAEYLYQTGRFRQALCIYMELMKQTSEQETEQRAILYYNMASIYAMDFAYAQAADFYYEAYKLKPDPHTRQAYILANKMAMTDFDYGVFMRENADWEQDFAAVEQMLAGTEQEWQQSETKKLLGELADYKAFGKMDEYYHKSGELIKHLKDDYRKQTM